MRRMPSLTREDERALAHLTGELVDVDGALDELERHREKLSAAVLAICRGAGILRWGHPRATLNISRYMSYKVERPGAVLPLLRARGWEDVVLSVKGRALHKLAQAHPDVVAALASFPQREKEALALRRG